MNDLPTPQSPPPFQPAPNQPAATQPTTPAPLPTGKFAKSKLLFAQSFTALKRDKSLLGIQLAGIISSITVTILAAALVVGYFYAVRAIPGMTVVTVDGQEDLSWYAYLPILLLVSVTLSTLTTFFATALSYGALRVFSGQNVTVKECLRAASQRFGSILAFGIFSGVIGALLRALEDRFGGLFMTLATRLVGAAWSIATMFVPAIIANSPAKIGPIDAARASVGVIKKTWGESLILTIGIGVVSSLIMVGYLVSSALITIVTAVVLDNAFVGLGLGALALIGLFALSIVFSTLGAIVNAALFYYATYNQAPAGFDAQLLQSALQPRQKKKLFAK